MKLYYFEHCGRYDSSASYCGYILDTGYEQVVEFYTGDIDSDDVQVGRGSSIKAWKEHMNELGYKYELVEVACD